MQFISVFIFLTKVGYLLYVLYQVYQLPRSKCFTGCAEGGTLCFFACSVGILRLSCVKGDAKKVAI